MAYFAFPLSLRSHTYLSRSLALPLALPVPSISLSLNLDLLPHLMRLSDRKYVNLLGRCTGLSPTPTVQACRCVGPYEEKETSLGLHKCVLQPASRPRPGRPLTPSSLPNSLRNAHPPPRVH
jgi:hypothetical protein